MTLHREREGKKMGEILDHFASRDYFTTRDIEDYLQCSDSSARKYIQDMMDLGKITGEQYAGRMRYCARTFFMARVKWVPTANEALLGQHRGER